jgi:predicted DNA-binding transcriptional regulator AlpA
MDDEQRRILTPAQVSEMTGLAQSTLANWRTLGKGPTWFKIGRLVRYDAEAVDAWLNGLQAPSSTYPS